MGRFNTPGGKGNIHRSALLARFLSDRFRRKPSASTAPERPPVRHRLLFEAMEQRVLLSGDPLPAFVVASVNGSLDVPGETDRYAFTLEDPTRVVFDSLSNDSRINWSLSGPGGSVVSSRALNQSDSIDFNTNPVLNLEAGEYLLSVDGDKDATGAYGFRLLDLSKGGELADGVAQSQTLDPANQTRVYRFVGSAGDRFFLDVTSRSGGDVYWRLLDPLDRLVFSSTQMNSVSQDQELAPLPMDGTYTLLVEGRAYRSDATNYGFTLHRIADPTTPETITIGLTVRGRLAMPGQRQSFDFELAGDGSLLFDALNRSGSFTWSLSGPQGTEVAARDFSQSDGRGIDGNPLLHLVAGHYTLTVDGVGDAQGDFAFRLLDLAGATAFTPGTEVAGRLDDAGTAFAHASTGAPLDYPEAETNRALRFVGNGAAVRVSDSASLRMSSALTIEAWIRPTGAGTGGGGVIVGKEGEYLLARFADGTIRWAFANTDPGWTYVNTGFVAPLDAWTHIAVVYDNGAVRTYANGALVHSYDGAGVIGDVDGGRNELRIGSREGIEQGFVGLIDEVRVWNVVRSEEEVAGKRTTLLGGGESGLVGYWRLDEANGVVVADRSSAGNQGTLVLAPVETQLYRFTASAGERFFLDAIDGTSPGFTVRLFDPFGNSVLSAGSRSFVDAPFTAAYDGEYVIAIEGFPGESMAPAAFRFKVQKIEDATASMSVGSLVSGAIEHAGQQRNYTFTLTEASRLLFDSRTYDNRLAWSLSGPRGAEVSSRSFTVSDSAEYGANSLLDLAPGTYTLTVGANGDATPAFAFVLMALAQAESITLDADVTGTLDPANATRVYRFDATAGDAVVFDRLSLSAGSPGWRLFDATGRQLFGPEYFDDRAPLTLLLSGTYYLALEGRIWDSGTISYGFNLRLQGNTPPPALEGTALTLGATVSGTIAAAGETDDYVFTVDEPTLVLVDSLAPNNNGSFRWTLTGPRGVEVSDRSFYYSESWEYGSANPAVQLVLPGTYQLRVRADGSTTGAYSFRVLDTAAATELTLGEASSATLNPANETDLYAFEASAGQRLYLDVAALSPDYGNWVSWRLLDPYGRQVLGPAGFNSNNASGGDDGFVVPLAGRYTLLVEGRIWVTQYTGSFAYTFDVHELVDAAPVALELGEVTSGTIAVAGARTTYTFTLDALTTLHFDSRTNSSTLNWTLNGPRGTVVSARALRSGDSVDGNSVLRLAAGDYTLVVDGSGDATGDFSFRLTSTASATELTPGTAVSGTLDPANATQAWRFDATAGERFFFDVQARSGGDVYWRLVDPDGRTVFGPRYMNWTDGSSDQDVLTLAKSGSYTLLIEGRYYTTGTASYTFNVQPVSDDEATLALDTRVDGGIAHAGQRDLYHFTLTAPTRLYVDSLTNNSALNWSLTGPTGTEVAGRSFTGSDSYDGTSLFTLPAGDYTLTVDGNGDATGDYAFVLRDLASATAITLGQTLNEVLDPANETDVYRFEGTSGDRLLFDILARSGGDVYWRLVDPSGRTVFGPANMNSAGYDVGPVTLTRDGTYTLFVEGRYYTSGSAAYSFRVQPVVDDVADIVPGENYGVDDHFVPGRIDGALQLDQYRWAEVAHDDALAMTGTLTFETWFRVDAYTGTWQALAYKGNGNGNQRSFTLWLNSSGYLHLSSGNNQNQSINTANGSVKLGQWHHVAAVMDRDTGVMTLYLDGVAAASGALSTTPSTANTNPLYLGGVREGWGSFVGAIDEVRVWNLARSAGQIAADYAAALQGDETGLVLYLPANEASGHTLGDASGHAHDATVRTLWDATSGVVAGRVATGESDYYRFTLDEERTFSFDSLLDNHYMRWYLSGPRGSVVSDRPFQQSDASDGTSILTLAPGDYELRVTAAPGNGGSYAFRLLDLGDAALLTLGETFSGQLRPGNETDAYRFDASAGDRLFFDVTTATGGAPYWRLLDPWGRTLWGPNYLPSDDVGLRTLPWSGTYTLLVEGRRDQLGAVTDYGLRVLPVADSTVAIAPGVASGMEPRWVEGQLGGAIGLNGLQYLEIADEADLEIGSAALTLEANVYIERFGNTWTPLFYKGNGNSAARSYSVWLQNNGSVWIGSTDASGQQSVQSVAGVLNAGEWHHVAVVFDRAGGGMRLLVDGVERLSGALRTQAALDQEVPLLVGYAPEPSTNYSGFIGRIDDLRVWQGARSNEAIAAAKDAALAGDESGLVAYLKADETVGDTLADASGHGNPALVRARTEGVVYGAIATPGQRVQHTFTLDEPGRLYFDALTNSSSLRWTLEGPRGVIVSEQRFDQSDSWDGRNSTSVFDLPAGDYTLSVRDTGDGTPAFAFRLLDLAAAGTITPGTPVSGRLSPVKQTMAYRFSASAGQRVYLDRIDDSGGDTYWRLVDPFGRNVFGPTAFNADAGLVTLAWDGEYTLLLEGRVQPDGDALYTFNVQPVSDTQTALTLGATVADAIAHAGDRHLYTFTLDAASRLCFDSLTNSSAFKWSLSGPRGTVVSSRAFSDSDSADFGASPVLDLAAGDYTLIVDPDNDAVGDYGFRLFDLGQAAELVLGDTVSATLASGRETLAYRIDAPARSRLLFDLLTENRDSAYWRLLDPWGGVVFGPSNTNDVHATLRDAGTYILLVEGRVNESNPVEFSFRVTDTVLPNPDNHTSQDFGEPGIPYVGASYGSGVAPMVLQAGHFPLTLSYNDVGVADTVFTGAPDDASAGLGKDGMLVYDLGGYRLIDGSGADLNVYEADSGAPEFDALRVEVSLDGVNYVDVTATAAARAPMGGGDEAHNNAGFARSYDLAGSGLAAVRYVRLTGLSGGAPGGDHGFDLDAIGLVNYRQPDGDPAPDPFLRLLPGSVTGINTIGFTATHPGVVPATVEAGFDLRITRVSNQGDGISFAWLDTSLWGRGGNAPQFGEEPNLAGSFGVGFDPVNNGEVSDNHVSLHFNGSKLAEFNLNTLMPGFRLDDGKFNHARIVIEATADGSTVSVYLTPEGGSEVAVVEDYFVAGMLPYEGRMAFGARNGGWRAHNDLDDVTLALTAGTAPVFPELTLGETTNGTLGTASEVDRFAFTLDASTRAYFDALTNNAALRWTLSGPRGTLVGGKSFTASDSAEGLSVLDLAAGDYVLSVQGATGSYAFRLLDLAQTTELALDTTVSGSFDPANETDAYRFTADAGQKVFFDITARSGGDARWRLIDPFGQVVFGPSGFNSTAYYEDVGPLTLAYAGEYTLLVESRYYQTAVQTYSLRVNTVSDDEFTLVPGETQSQAIAVPGQHDVYRFTLDEAKRMYFDFLSATTSYDNYYLRWTLSGPLGEVVSNRPFRASDSSDGTSILDLGPGEYTLTVHAPTDTSYAADITGSYGFRLLDLAAATPLALDTTVSSSFDPAAETDAYRFTAEAGQAYFFDITARSGGDAYWRLLDPFGRPVFGPSNFNNPTSYDVGPLTLAYAGEYTLLVESRYYQTAAQTYSLRVNTVNDRSLALALGATQSEAITVAGQRDVYHFTLDDAKRVYFDFLAANTNYDNYYLRWTLSGPQGAVASNRPFRASDSSDGTSIFDLGPGEYTLTVQAPVDTTYAADITGSYSFRLLDLASAGVLTPGTTVNATLTPSTETDAYRFDVVAGERFYFDVTARSGGDVYWRLLDPWGRPVFGPGVMNSTGDDVDVLELPFTGTYTLLVEGRYYTTGEASYAFNVSDVSLSAPIELVLGTRPGPDLVVQDLAVTAAGDGTIESGREITLSWSVTNSGDEAAAGPWDERVIVRNLDRGGELVANVLVAFAGDALAAGASAARSLVIRLPEGSAGAGRMQVDVLTDVANAVAEQGAFGQAENNNSARIEFGSELARYPDLLISNVVVEPAAGWAPGSSVTLRWRVSNAGNAPVRVPWSD
ncbi:MAG: LEPR-XLL domain-containing protein, partial [Pseudomonadales bacterium]|nr:LEPR-XLL domain-containing protein [Pseudomonadales bacterium]